MKRVFDIVFVILTSAAWLPILLSVALLVRLKIGSPVLFVQERPGLHGRAFKLIKFRTMTDARSADGGLLPDVERVTRFGAWLRATSLDELPEIWNVVKGDMSLVGPRPLLMEYLPHYSSEQARRHAVRPGITGWAQVNGRNELAWDERFELDVWYVDNRSLGLDLRIIALTLLRVCQRRGISWRGETTMPRFKGRYD